MKKRLFLIPLFLATFSLSACSLFDFFNKDEPYIEIDPPEGVIKKPLKYNVEDFIDNNVYDLDSCPTTGEPKLLVIPVWFLDSSSYISEDKKETIRKDIEKSYFGTNEETGWRSVKTYYEELSHGKVKLTGVVTDWFECGYRSTTISEDGTNTLVTKAVNWYKEKNNISNLSEFDTDNNGHLDGVMLIYGAPDYAASGQRNTNLWAYCYWLQNNDAKVGNPTPNVFFWASYDFMYGKNSGMGNRVSGDTTYATLDTHTYIHEMGHVFGLEDYYDYSNQYTPAGSFSMQDYNVGSHDPFSVLSLGWVEPHIPTETTTISINPFQDNGDVILLANHNVDSPFDEYLLLELYTPTGLNEFDSKHSYCGNYPKGPNSAGVRIWHVDDRLVYSKTGRFNASNVTTNPKITSGRVTHMMSNTYYAKDSVDYCSPLGQEYSNYNMLQLIRNNINNTYCMNDNLSSSSMFKTGDSFMMESYKKQFVKTGKLNDASELGWEVNFQTVNANQAIIEVTKL